MPYTFELKSDQQPPGGL